MIIILSDITGADRWLVQFTVTDRRAPHRPCTQTQDLYRTETVYYRGRASRRGGGLSSVRGNYNVCG